MGTTLIEPRKRGADPKKLTMGELRFCLEMLACNGSNATECVRVSFPKCKNPTQYAGKLLKRPRIKAYLGKVQKEDGERLELDRLEVLRQLWNALTRKIKDFSDASGLPLPPHKLPPECQSIVDGYKVKVLKKWNTEEEVCEILSIEYRLTPHAVAREQAMKHKGLFAPEEHNVKHEVAAIDWALMQSPPGGENEIEAEFRKLEGPKDD